jgi:hypothetical protein
MNLPTDNESWIIDAGDVIVRKRAHAGIGCLSPIERLIYCLWVADYGMRNAGDLEAARDVYADFQREAAKLARELRIQHSLSAFSLAAPDLQREYLERFDDICNELRRYAETSLGRVRP